MEICNIIQEAVINAISKKKKWSLETNIAEIRLIILFSAEDGEALYSQQKQDRELTVAQIMNYLLQNTGLYWRT